MLCVEGMWFQDLWTYDFRRTEMCVIPYGTQEGEISFCAYNTGVGWRQIIENMHQTATLAEWHRTEGRHEIFAKGKSVQLKTTQHSLTLPIIQPSSESGAVDAAAAIRDCWTRIERFWQQSKTGTPSRTSALTLVSSRLTRPCRTNAGLFSLRFLLAYVFSC